MNAMVLPSGDHASPFRSPTFVLRVLATDSGLRIDDDQRRFVDNGVMCVVGRRDYGDFLPVGRPGHLHDVQIGPGHGPRRGIAESDDPQPIPTVKPIDFDRVGFVVYRLGGRECDLGAVGRPAVVDDSFERFREAGGKLAVGSQQPDLIGLGRSIPLGKERQPFSVGRPLGMMDVGMPEGRQSWLTSLRGRGHPQVGQGTAPGIAGIGRFHDDIGDLAPIRREGQPRRPSNVENVLWTDRPDSVGTNRRCRSE